MPPHPQALFSLEALNERANDVVTHRDNAHLMSYFCPDRNNPNVVLQGLEVGFHVRPTTSRYTLAIIGGDGDIKIDDPDISSYHCSFELQERNMEEVMLQDVSPDNTTEPSGPTAMPFRPEHPHRRVLIDRNINRDFGIGGADCDLYKFRIHWHKCDERIVRQCIDNRGGNPYHIRTVADEPPTSVSSLPFTPIRYSRRQKLGKGTFGQVWEVANADTGEHLAMKRVVRPPTQSEYATMIREVDLLSLVSHRNIVELITSQDANYGHFEIFMPVKTGSVQYLIEEEELFTKEPASVDPLLHQMLQALDCLDSRGIIHRDVKPENILYTPLPDGKYLYQLADFGLANTVDRAQTWAGTERYMAPELYLGTCLSQTTKMDIWSLYVTLAYAMNAYGFQEKSSGKPYWRILEIVKEVAKGDMLRELRDMAIEEPDDRATAGDMLEKLFGGEGRTTSQNRGR
ncbi:hypothetical protein CEP54_001063 [Fusarium duplospermum]|uniref:mitogen-activated protein kinase n=1 Tax=Fusarium duplospermum TaxID=1325734 RepID=A0A428R333_9HYPO|nr:hypothetical protein CEP54_001063 [Fusarium duplospermum]